MLQAADDACHIYKCKYLFVLVEVVGWKGGGVDHVCSTVGYRKGIGGLTQKNLHTADCSGVGTKVRADQCVPASLVIFESTIRFENQLF